VVYGAPTLKHLAEFVLPTFEKRSQELLPRRDIRPHYNGRDRNTSSARTAAYVHLFGADDKRKANRGRGPEAVLAIFDEAGFCPLLRYVLRSIFRPSLLHSGGRTLVASTPAEEPDHDFTAIAELAEANGAYFNRDVWDNPRLTDVQIDRFIAEDARDEGMTVEAYLDSDEFRREYKAERVINKMLLGVPEWVAPWKDGKPYRESHVVDIPRPKLFRGHTIIDFGGNDPHAFQLGYWHLELGMVIERDQLLKSDERSQQLADAVKKAEEETWGVDRWNGTLASLTAETIKGHFSQTHQQIPDWLMPEVDRTADAQPWTRICDQNRELARHLHSVGLAAVPTYKTDKQFMVQQLRNLIAAGKYWVHPRCKDTDRHLKTTTWANAKRREWSHRGGEHGDLVDDSVYFAMGVSREVLPDPEAAVASGLTVGAMVREMQKLEAKRQNLADAFLGNGRLSKMLRKQRR
jgi:hypothetical protein